MIALQLHFQTFSKCRSDSRQSRKIPDMSRAGLHAQCLCIQGAQCSESAPISLACLAVHLQSCGLTVLVLLPERDDIQRRTAPLLRDTPVRTFQSALMLRELVAAAQPACVVLSSHDACFQELRRDRRTVRWAHEVQRCYDPQASRCFTPLFAAAPQPLLPLAGFVGMARSYATIAHLDCSGGCYTPGPLRVLGCGDMSNPRCNFKAFEALASKHNTIRFLWHGATRNKRWGNIDFYNADVSLMDVWHRVDMLLWCEETDLCPLLIFQALWSGIRVMLFEKSFQYGLTPLNSDLDGSPLLQISSGALLQAPLHKVPKNPRASADIVKAREYVQSTVGHPPPALVQAVLGLVSDHSLTVL